MTKIIVKRSIFFILLCSIITSCEEDPVIPKRSTCLQIDFPDYKFHEQKGTGPYEFNLPDVWTITPRVKYNGNTCQEEIDLATDSKYHGIAVLTYYKYKKKDNLFELINDSNMEVEYEKIMANTIHYSQIIDEDNQVYGTFFELIGNGVATPFQFYLTDSLENYIHGKVLLSYTKYNCAKPLLNHVKTGVLELINTIKWVKD
jgi:gliding motility-associated lipoprotein GldD